MKKEYVSPILDTQLVEYSGCIMAGSDPNLAPGGGTGGAGGTLNPMPGAPKKA